MNGGHSSGIIRLLLTSLILLFIFTVWAGITTSLLLTHHDKIKMMYETKPIPAPTKTQIITKVKTKTIYKNGYQFISQDPAWNCAGNWYNAYIRVVNNPNAPTGDSGLWDYYCPGVPMPAN